MYFDPKLTDQVSPRMLTAPPASQTCRLPPSSARPHKPRSERPVPLHVYTKNWRWREGTSEKRGREESERVRVGEEREGEEVKCSLNSE